MKGTKNNMTQKLPKLFPLLPLLLSYGVAMEELSSPTQNIETTKTSCILQSEYKNKTQEELKNILLTKAKAEALEELYGTMMKTKTELKNGKLISDEIKSLAVGSVRIKGEPEFSNGKNFGEVCAKVQSYITPEDFIKYQPKQIKLTNYCLLNTNIDEVKQEAFKTIIQIQRPNLTNLTSTQASDFIHGYEIANQTQTSNQTCFDITASILPFEIDSFQELTNGKIVKDSNNKEIIVDNGIKVTFYKKEDTALKTPIASKIITDNFDLMKVKFLVDTLKSGEVYNVILETYIEANEPTTKNFKFASDVYSLTYYANNKSILKNKQGLYPTSLQIGYNPIKIVIKTADYFDVAMFEKIDKTETIIPSSELYYEVKTNNPTFNLK